MNGGHRTESSTPRQGSVYLDTCDTWKQVVPCQRSIDMHTVSSHHNPRQEQQNQQMENARRSNTKYILQTYSLKYTTTYNIQLQWKKFRNILTNL